jgi:hypothetical protein
MAEFHVVAGYGPPENRSPNDYYPTPPQVTRALFRVEDFPGRTILEPCSGAGHMVEPIIDAGYNVVTNEPWPVGDHTPDHRLDFLKDKVPGRHRAIVTNPPYRLGQEFVQRAIDLGIEKHAWLLRFQFMEGGGRWSPSGELRAPGRYHFFEKHPPARIHIFSRRVQISELGLEEVHGGMIVYAWWVWERDHRGGTQLRWLPPDICYD